MASYYIPMTHPTDLRAMSFRYWNAQCDLAGGIHGVMLLACSGNVDHAGTLAYVVGQSKLAELEIYLTHTDGENYRFEAP